jgi:hypothetical protein
VHDADVEISAKHAVAVLLTIVQLARFPGN